MNEYIKNVLANFKDVLKNHYTDFKGTVTRNQFWQFILCIVICYLIAALISMPLKAIGAILAILITLGSMIPCIAITVRRVRDSGFDYRFGFFSILLYAYALLTIVPAKILLSLFSLINFVAFVMLIIFCALPSKQD
ncbi:MAG: DUF805 domain-containing protein [Elusimicrobiaceae bacterium]|nr:DUF805 domain-containing protein [Elusimicrobiaceae bacterium]